MKYYIITGTSKGLGKALAERLLTDPEHFVIGISRTVSIQHDNYQHLFIDLSDVHMLHKHYNSIFPDFRNPSKICLINNAGNIGEITYLGKQHDEKIIEGYNCNVIAPALLMNEFVRRYKNNEAAKLVLNISSGAGKKPVDGWSVYCSSKAALDMQTAVAANEAKFSHTNFRFFSLAPGILDTPMQTEIRKVAPEDFSRVEEFINYKKEHMLVSPEKVADKIVWLLENESNYKGVVMSVSEV
jgi:benzil reductase ((S)-benzoin forming)